MGAWEIGGLVRRRLLKFVKANPTTVLLIIGYSRGGHIVGNFVLRITAEADRPPRVLWA